MIAVVGQKAPNLGISEWVQGNPTNIDQEKDHVLLIEVFQINCPGCFLYAFPNAISMYTKYKKRGLRVLGIATAFEDFDKNTLENLKVLAETGEVIGETRRALSKQGHLREGNKLPYQIPFPLGMDRLSRTNGEVTQAQIMRIIRDQVPNFEQQSEAIRDQIVRQVKSYLKSKEYSAETFETFALRGTPSSILIDRDGILRDVSFGQSGNIQRKIEELL